MARPDGLRNRAEKQSAEVVDSQKLSKGEVSGDRASCAGSPYNSPAQMKLLY